MNKPEVVPVKQMSDAMVNSVVKIRGTVFDRTRRYGDFTKQYWKILHQNGVPISTIAGAYGASTTTVRKTVDESYLARDIELRKARLKKYKLTHPVETNWGEYKKNLASHKRTPDVSHLKSV